MVLTGCASLRKDYSVLLVGLVLGDLLYEEVKERRLVLKILRLGLLNMVNYSITPLESE